MILIQSVPSKIWIIVEQRLIVWFSLWSVYFSPTCQIFDNVPQCGEMLWKPNKVGWYLGYKLSKNYNRIFLKFSRPCSHSLGARWREAPLGASCECIWWGYTKKIQVVRKNSKKFNEIADCQIAVQKRPKKCTSKFQSWATSLKLCMCIGSGTKSYRSKKNWVISL